MTLRSFCNQYFFSKITPGSSI